jgi:hypothetical protein
MGGAPPAAGFLMTQKISEFTDQPVDTFSESWRHECECRWLLALPTREQRNRFLYGYTDSAGKKQRGVADIRGAEAAAKLKRDAERLFYIRKNRAAAPEQPDLLSA